MRDWLCLWVFLLLLLLLPLTLLLGGGGADGNLVPDLRWDLVDELEVDQAVEELPRDMRESVYFS